MSDHHQTSFFLTGAYQGRTITLGGKYRFQKGVCTIIAPLQDIALHARFLERNWQAYPEGHPKLEVINGQRDIQKTTEPDPEQAVSSNVQPNGEGADTDQPASDGEESTDPEAGESGVLPNGDGHAPELNERLQRAVMSLDPNNDEHWTQTGKPAMTAIEKLYGATDVTRNDVEAVAPNFNRTKAQKESAPE